MVSISPWVGDRVGVKAAETPGLFHRRRSGGPGGSRPSYPIRMAFLIMLRTGLRVSEALSLRRSDLRLGQDPPVISVRPEAPGSKGREVPIPADLLEGLAYLASFHSKDRSRPMLDISRQWVGESMKRAAATASINPAPGPPPRLPPHLWPQLRPTRRPSNGTAALAWPSVLGRHPALRRTGRHPPLLGGQVIRFPARSENLRLLGREWDGNLLSVERYNGHQITGRSHCLQEHSVLPVAERLRTS